MTNKQGTVTGIDHVQLAAPSGCETVARYFYGELLGLPEVPKPPTLVGRGGVWFQAGAQGLHIGVEAAFTPARKAHPALLVHDLDALAERLAVANVAITWDAELPGYHRCYVADPWGNRIELLEPLG